MWRCSLNRAGNTYWLSSRRITQPAAVQALPALSIPDRSRSISPAAVSRWLGLIPSWIILGMILLATLAICATVIVRTRAQLQTSAIQYERMVSEIDSLRRSNTSLEIEIRRMTSDPSMIESAARSRLGMVRPNDIVVPLESVPVGSN